MKNTKKLNVETKTHFKMYKSGKFWVMSGMSLAMLAMGGQADLKAHAAGVDAGTTSQSIAGSQGSSAAQGAGTPNSQTNSQSATSGASQSGSQSANTQSSASASATPSTSISAIADNATDRSNFNSSLSSTSSTGQNTTNNTNSSAASDTSQTVALPDDIANLTAKFNSASANKTEADVATWADFQKAYTNNQITYIRLTANIAVDTANANNNLALGERTASVIIDGAGFSLNLGKSALRTGQATDANGNATDASGNRVKSTFTITNITLLQKATGDNLVADSGKNGAPDAAIDAYAADGSYGGWNYNINNLTLTGVSGQDSKDQSTQPLRLLDAEGSSVVLSGTVSAYVRQEMMQIGKVSIVNGANITMQRVAGYRDSGYSMFFFSAWRQNQSMNSNATGYAHTFTVGDGATISAYDKGSDSQYPVVLGAVQTVRVGDNVTWTQSKLKHFIDQNFYTNIPGQKSQQTFIFGRNFTVNIPYRSIDGKDFFLTGDIPTTISFAPGLTMNVEQINRTPMFNLGANTTITFDAPKDLHFNMRDMDYTGAFDKNGSFDKSLFNISGSSKVVITQATTKVWDNKTSYSTNKDGVTQTNGGTLTITANGATSVANKDRNGNVATTDGNKTREVWATNDGAPGKVQIQFVNDQGVPVGQTITLTGSQYQIGQKILLKSSDFINQIPANYAWAVNQSQLPQNWQQLIKNDGDPNVASDDAVNGQALYALVPSTNLTNTYTIFVFGLPKTGVSYEYYDAETNTVLAAKGNVAPTTDTANYGHTIDWTSGFYTNDNVPTGYHYDKTAANQPGKELVDNINGTVRIYVAGNAQTVQPTYVNIAGQTVTPKNATTITGNTGTQINLPTDVSVDGFMLSSITVQGRTYDITAISNQEFRFLTDQSTSIKYTFATVEQRKSIVQQQFTIAASTAIQTISASPTLSGTDKQSYIQKVIQARQDAISSLTDVTDADTLSQKQSAGVQSIQSVVPKTDQAMQSNLTTLNSKTQTATDAINNDKGLTAVQKAAQQSVLKDLSAAALQLIVSTKDQSTIANQLNQYFNQIDQVYQSGVVMAQQADQVDKATAKQIIQKDPSLTALQKQNMIANLDKVGLQSYGIDMSADTIASVRAANQKALLQDATKSDKTVDQLKTDTQQALYTSAQAYQAAVYADTTLSESQKAAKISAINQQLANAFAAVSQVGATVASLTSNDSQADQLANINTAYTQAGTGNFAQAVANTAADSSPAIDGMIDQAIQKAKNQVLIGADKNTEAIKQVIDENTKNVKNTILGQLNTTLTSDDVTGATSNARTVLSTDKNDSSAVKGILSGIDSSANTTFNNQTYSDKAVNDWVKSQSDAIDNNSALSLADKIQAKSYINQVATGLQAAHDQKLSALMAQNNVKSAVSAAFTTEIDNTVNQLLANDPNKQNVETQNAIKAQTALQSVQQDIPAALTQQAGLLNAAATTRAAINSSTDLTNAEKQAALNNLVAKEQAAIAAVITNGPITEGDTAQLNDKLAQVSLANVQPDGVKTLADRKTDAVTTLSAAIDQIKTTVQANRSLTTDQQTTQLAALDNLKKSLTNQINGVAANGSTPAVAGIANAQDLADFVAQQEANLATQQQQFNQAQSVGNAYNTVQNQVVNTTNAINNDQTLTAAQRTVQQNQLTENTSAPLSTLKTASDNLNTALTDQAKAQNDLASAQVNSTSGSGSTGNGGSGSNENTGSGSTNNGGNTSGSGADLTQLNQNVTDAVKAAADAMTAVQTPTTTNGTATGISASTLAQFVNEAPTAAKQAGVTMPANSVLATNVHQSAQNGIDGQKSAALTQVSEQYAQTYQAINDDKGWTQAQKQSQVDDLNNKMKQATDAITAITTDTANYAQAITTASADGAQSIATAHVVQSQTIDNLKTDAATAVQNGQLASTTAQINNDQNLTTAERNNEIASLPSATDLQSYFKDAQDAQQIADIQAAVNQTVTSRYVKGATVAERQAAATQSLNAQIAAMKTTIQNDPTLPSQGTVSQQSQLEALNQVQAKYLGTDGKGQTVQTGQIAATSDKEQFATLLLNINQDVAAVHPANATNSLADQQAAAKQVISAYANTVIGKINADAGLTTDEQQAQINDIQSHLADKQAEIDNLATVTADKINEQVTNAKAQIDQQHVSGDIYKARNEAVQAIQDHKNDVFQQIGQDQTLTSSQKTDQQAQLARQISTISTDVQKYQTANDIAAYQQQVFNSLDQTHQHGAGLDQDQHDATDRLNNAVAQATTTINGDNRLTDSDRSTQLAAVQAAATQVQQTIANATTADALTQLDDTSLLNTVQQGYNNAVKSGAIQDLSTQATAAASDLGSTSYNEKSNIQMDDTLNVNQKTEQQNAINQALSDGQAAIQAAQKISAQAVKQAHDDAANKILSIHQSDKPLADQRSDSQSEMEKYFQTVTDQINADKTLLPSDRQTQLTLLRYRKSDATQLLTMAQTAQSILDTNVYWQNYLNNAHTVGQDLSIQKQDSAKTLASKADDAIAAVKADKRLNDDQMAQQVTDIQNRLATATNDINQQNDAESIQEHQTTQLSTIYAGYQPGEEMPVQIQKFPASLDTVTQSVLQDVQNDVTLTDQEKAEQKAQIQAKSLDQDLKNQEITKAASATVGQDLAVVRGDWQQNLAAFHKSGQPLDQQKQVAKDAIDQAGQQIIVGINANATFTAGQKTELTSFVQDQVSQAKAKIDAADNAQELQDMQPALIAQLQSAYQAQKQQVDQANQAEAAREAAAAAASRRARASLLSSFGIQASADDVTSDQVKTTKNQESAQAKKAHEKALAQANKKAHANSKSEKIAATTAGIGAVAGGATLFGVAYKRRKK